MNISKNFRQSKKEKLFASSTACQNFKFVAPIAFKIRVFLKMSSLFSTPASNLRKNFSCGMIKIYNLVEF